MIPLVQNLRELLTSAPDFPSDLSIQNKGT